MHFSVNVPRIMTLLHLFLFRFESQEEKKIYELRRFLMITETICLLLKTNFFHML